MSDEKQPEKEGLWARFGPLLTSWAIFLGVLGTMVGIYEWKPNLVNRDFARWTADLMGRIMELLGEEMTVKGVFVRCTHCRFVIIGECTAYYPLAIYIAAVLGFPAPWLRRIAGVILGIPLILLVNQVRLISLCYIAEIFPEHFDTIHIVIWQSLIIFFTVLVWILWVTTIGKKP